uniref:Sulfatase N-terminal domain-containing protein n=1 Tax=Aplanochytrium stocchinoi TaxID=215587 RepID=A0A7S3PLL4_9STRA
MAQVVRQPIILLVLLSCFIPDTKSNNAEIGVEIGERSPPNILLLYADDLGYGDISSYNQDSKIQTPNIDRLANNGMSFTDAHSSSGVCSPSRYALLTGRYHWRKFHEHLGRYGAPVLDKIQLTLAEMLKDVGYHTALVGKWHLGWDWNAIKKNPNNNRDFASDFDWSKRIPGGPIERGGFDYYFGDDVINFPPYCWFENEGVYGQIPNDYFNQEKFKQLNQKEGSMQHNAGPMRDDWDFYAVLPTLLEKGIKYIETRDKVTPWFLFFSFPSPHLPIIPNDKFDGASDAGPYGDSVVQLDDSVGRLLHAVDAAGFTQNTLVVFTSDNGPETLTSKLAYVRATRYGHWSSGILRGAKRDLYEGGHRVPMIFKWPGIIPEGKTISALISQIDIFATVAAIVGYELTSEDAEDSYNQLPLLSGNYDEKGTRDTIIYNTNEVPINRVYAVRHKELVYITSKTGYTWITPPQTWNNEYGYRDDWHNQGQLYNLTSDVGQRRNIIPINNRYQIPPPLRPLIKQLKALLTKIRTSKSDSPRLLPMCLAKTRIMELDEVINRCKYST